MRNLLVFVCLCIISSGFAHYGSYNSYHGNGNSYHGNGNSYHGNGNSWDWNESKNYPDYNSNSWGKRTTRHPHSDNEDYSGNYDDFYDTSNNYNWHENHNSRDKGCVTPNGEKAKCIALNNCPILKGHDYNYYRRGRFFMESVCDHSYSGPLVCCGTKYKYTHEEPTTHLPSYTRRYHHNHWHPEGLPQWYPKTTLAPVTSTPVALAPVTSTPIALPPVTLAQTTLEPVTLPQTTLPPVSLAQTTLPPVSFAQTTLPPILTTPAVQETRRMNPIDIPNVAIPPNTETVNLKSHRNFNLLPSRDTCGLHALEDKLFGGNETDLTEFPWMALLEYQANGISTGYRCGGMLINNRYVLTAAHCVSGKNVPAGENIFRVRIGEHDVNTIMDCRTVENNIMDCNLPPQDITVEETIVHPGFDDSNENMFDDIALLRLSGSPAESDFVRPICLPTEGERAIPGANLMIAGWGVTEIESTSNVKLKASVPYLDDNVCKTIWANTRIISDEQFCAGGSDGVSACAGDSGGPIMYLAPRTINWYVEGIVSFGKIPCGTFPNVYIRVSSYISWILDTIKP